MDLSYLGTAYHGWQIQPNALTVQSAIHEALSKILQTPMEVVGSGRTDTGVHAAQQVVHFDTDAEISPDLLAYRLNSLLPKSIAINHIRPVIDTAHARFDALSRTYHYHIHSRKNPFKDQLSYLFTKELDIPQIQAALAVIRQRTDFEALSKVHTDVNHFHCEIFEAHWEQTNDGYQFCVSANRFLRGMVRAMVGTLLEVGSGRMSLQQLEDVLNSQNRSNAGRAVPPQGLYLVSVKYPQSVYLD